MPLELGKDEPRVATMLELLKNPAIARLAVLNEDSMVLSLRRTASRRADKEGFPYGLLPEGQLYISEEEYKQASRRLNARITETLDELRAYLKRVRQGKAGRTSDNAINNMGEIRQAHGQGQG